MNLPSKRPRWSLRLGRILGVDVYLHVTFLLLLVLLASARGMAEGSAAAALQGAVSLSLLFGCVLLHEFGHVLAARRYGIGTRDIILLPIGGIARLERMPEKPWQEFAVAAAGPAVNLVIAAGLYLGLAAAGKPLPSELGMDGGLIQGLIAVNLFLALFNLLPAFPMDGGRMLRSALAARMDYARATRVAAGVGRAFAVGFAVLALFGNFMLLIIAAFVWLGATQEKAAADARGRLRGIPVREAMLTRFETLATDDTVGDAARLLLRVSQQDFPVLRNGLLAGLLTRDHLLAALRHEGEFAPIEKVMASEYTAARPDEPLEDALRRLSPDGVAAIPVLQHSALVGLVTAENIGELYMISSALGRRGLSPRPAAHAFQLLTGSRLLAGIAPAASPLND